MSFNGEFEKWLTDSAHIVFKYVFLMHLKFTILNHELLNKYFKKNFSYHALVEKAVKKCENLVIECEKCELDPALKISNAILVEINHINLDIYFFLA